MYHTILFDLDGTLIDPVVGITTCVAYALKRFGIHVEDRRKLHRFIGPPLHGSFMEYYGLDEAAAHQAVAYYRERFSTVGVYENELYDGVPELLSELTAAGKQLILATSKPEEYAKMILEHHHIAPYFTDAVGSLFSGERTAKADVITEALRRCSITDKRGTVMVGDRKHDILGANAMGLDSIGVLYGYGPREEHKAAGATHIVGTISELRALLLEK